MMRIEKAKFILRIFLLAVVSGSPAVFAADTELIVLPFRNLSSDYEAKKRVMPLVYAALETSGFRPVAEVKTAEVLRHHRVRDTGQISRETAGQLHTELGTHLILLGSIDLLEGGDTPQSGFAVRCIDARSGEILWAETRYSSAEEYGGILGIGRIASLEDLLEREIGKLFAPFSEYRLNLYTADPVGADLSTTQRSQIVLIPFENATATYSLNQILTSVLLTEITKKGYRVVEPGMVKAELLSESVLPSGEIDYGTLKRLVELWPTMVCITGSVLGYRLSAGPDGTASPEVTVHARMLDATSGQMIWARTLEQSGSDYETVLGLGRIISPGKLLQATAVRLVDSLPATKLNP
jgi:TolB-like protein